MKGLKISPPQSVARIDHTSFLCAENGASSAYPSGPPIYHPLSVLSSFALFHPPFLFFSLSPLSCFPRCPFTLPSLRPVRATCHSSSNLSAAALCTCVLSRRFAGPPWKRGIYEILVKTLLSGLSGRLRRVLGHACTCKRFRPVGRMTPL